MGGFNKTPGYKEGFRPYGESGLFYKTENTGGPIIVGQAGQDSGDRYKPGSPLYSAPNDDSELVTKGSLASKDPQGSAVEKINPKTQQSVKPISDSVVSARNDQKRRASTPTGSILTDQFIAGSGSKTLLGQ